jgi:hypothetical protein
MGFNTNDATSFEDMAAEQEVVKTPATEPATEEVVETEATEEVADKPCDCKNCDCKNTEEV